MCGSHVMNIRLNFEYFGKFVKIGLLLLGKCVNISFTLKQEVS